MRKPFCPAGHDVTMVGRNTQGRCLRCVRLDCSRPEVKLYQKMRNIRVKFGLTQEQYTALIQAQNGKCRICHEPKKLCVDHDHKTGRVRGLLCIPCNTWVGVLENESFVIRAREYLQG